MKLKPSLRIILATTCQLLPYTPDFGLTKQQPSGLMKVKQLNHRQKQWDWTQQTDVETEAQSAKAGLGLDSGLGLRVGVAAALTIAGALAPPSLHRANAKLEAHLSPWV